MCPAADGCYRQVLAAPYAAVSYHLDLPPELAVYESYPGASDPALVGAEVPSGGWPFCTAVKPHCGHWAELQAKTGHPSSSVCVIDDTRHVRDRPRFHAAISRAWN